MEKNLSIEEKIGQMLMIGIYGYDVDEYTLKFIKQYKVGGIILFKRNINDTKQMQELIQKLKQVNRENGNIPLFISIDQEGGRVNRLPKEINRFQLGSKIGEKNNENYAYEQGYKVGKALKSLGVNMNLAPVLDLRTSEDDYHFIGDRAISQNKKIVSKLGVQLIKGMQDGGIISIAKHFPGHGMSKKDSHFRIPRIDVKKENMMKHIQPFKDAMKAGVDGILSSHMVINYIDYYKPITISKKAIQHLVRKKIKYDGIVMTDDLMMRSLVFYHVFGIPMQEAIQAGNDILLLCKNNRKKEREIQKLLREAKQGKIDEKLIDKSVERILRLKEKYQIQDEPSEMMTVEQVNEILK